MLTRFDVRVRVSIHVPLTLSDQRTVSQAFAEAAHAGLANVVLDFAVVDRASRRKRLSRSHRMDASLLGPPGVSSTRPASGQKGSCASHSHGRPIIGPNEPRSGALLEQSSHRSSKLRRQGADVTLPTTEVARHPPE